VVPGSTGRQAAESLGEDEDAEERSESAQMDALAFRNCGCQRESFLFRRSLKFFAKEYPPVTNQGCQYHLFGS